MSAPEAATDPLAPRIRELFMSLEHAGGLETSDNAHIARGEAGREALGTRVRFELQVDRQRVHKVRYRAYGCPYTLAACEWLARSLEGGPTDVAALGGPLSWAQQLGVPAAKLGRLLVIEDALRAALTQS